MSLTSFVDPALEPLCAALAAVVAAAHSTLTSLGADPASGPVWVLCVVAVVVAVRITLLPLTAHGVRLAHASARARPHLLELTRRYRGRRDATSLRALAAERRRIAAEHGVPRLGLLPLLVQLPLWMALYHLMAQLAEGVPMGALDAALVASLGAATLLGVPSPSVATSGRAGRTCSSSRDWPGRRPCCRG